VKLLVCKDGEWTVDGQGLAVEKHSCSGTTQSIELSELQVPSQAKQFDMTDIDPLLFSEMFAFGFIFLLSVWVSIFPIATAIKSFLEILRGSNFS
jgi:hypothetical protein